MSESLTKSFIYEYGNPIHFITLGDPDNPAENERIEKLMSLPRFRYVNGEDQACYTSDPIIFSLDDVLYFWMYNDIDEFVECCGAIVCMKGVLKKERQMMFNLLEICASFNIPMYFEDMLEIELRELDKRKRGITNEKVNDIRSGRFCRWVRSGRDY